MASAMEDNKKSTTNKPVGLLVNGVELYSPSIFNEVIYYGEIESISVLNGGEEYDVITPPKIKISDPDGAGNNSVAYANMKGRLTDVLVTNQGIGYSQKPRLSIVGGNYTGEIQLETNLIKKTISSTFFPNSSGVGNTTITFINDHNFITGEEVVYNSNQFSPIVGLIEDTSYFVGVVNSKTISLYTNYSNSLEGINFLDTLSTVVGLGTGVHIIETKEPKNVVDRVYIENPEYDFYYKSVRLPSRGYPNNLNTNGISISEDYFYAKNHNLLEKDLLIYECTGTPISGVSTTQKYFVSIIDENKFKLASAGSDTIPDETNYNEKTYVSISGVGVGTHIFKYPPVEIIVKNDTDIAVTSPIQLKPIILGEIESIYVEDGGVGYGASEIVNFNRTPIININQALDEDEDALISPIISNGKIVDAFILNPGNNYQEDIDIIIQGDGKYAKLYPIIEDGKIVEVKILSSGAGYNSQNTSLFVRRRGRNAKLFGNIQKWIIDQYFKNKSIIDNTSGNGFIIPSRNIKNTPQFINFFPPKQGLRDLLGDDLINKSPILGWAYDGNPIFGPSFLDETLNEVVLAKSGYKLNTGLARRLSTNKKRPPTSIFNPGYFIEDNIYNPQEGDLDENNGKFITSAEGFPNGTYAYFHTVNNQAQQNPVYPYVIGPEFHNIPTEFNNSEIINQNIDFNEKQYIKNTNPLYLTDTNSGYDYIKLVDDKYKQNIIIKNVLSSGVDGFEIIEAGDNYKVGDKILFSVEDDQDTPPNAEVSKINGKNIQSINVGITTLTNIIFEVNQNNIVGYSTTSPHGLSNNQYVNITGNLPNEIKGIKKIRVKDKTVKLLSNTNSTGITTVIQVNDISDFEVDDFIQIDEETAKIAQIYAEQNKFLVIRLEDLSSHTAQTSTVSVLPRKFEYDNNSLSEDLSIINLNIFNPKTSVGLGTTGSLIVNENTNSTYFVNTQNIYIPNHSYKANQKLNYSFETGFNGLLVSNTPSGATYRLSKGQNVYAKIVNRDAIGISTVSYGSTLLTFREASYVNDQVHSFTFNRKLVKGNVETFDLSFTTSSNHQLQTNDTVNLLGVDNTFEAYVSKFDLSSTYQINVENSNTFSINLNKKPDFINYTTNLNADNFEYITNSKNATGGIADIKLNYTSSFYREIPTVEEISSLNGSGAIIIPTSNNIGKIDTVDRIKDGFDYPSDITLQPKLGTNTICYVDGISKINKIQVLYGGNNYNTPPTLKVLERDDIILRAIIKNSIITGVKVVKTPNNLTNPLEIVSINNSNGVDILDIYPISSTRNRIKFDIVQFPLIYRNYLEPVIDFPFEVGDLILIENCKITEADENTYNSIDNDFKYFEVTAISPETGELDYSTENIPGVTFGTYSTLNGYGTVTNKNRLPQFSMILEKNNYINGETLSVTDNSGNVVFSGQVEINGGWDRDRNKLRVVNSQGLLKTGSLIKGGQSLLEGKVIYGNSFTLNCSFGEFRDKEIFVDISNVLDSDVIKLQDGNYYQDFSYSIKSSIPYEEWREPVKSIIHPSGLNEFSDLQIISRASNNLSIAKTDNAILEILIGIENEKSFFEKTNYTIAYEDGNRTSSERINFGSGEELWQIAGDGKVQIPGIDLLPYILNKTNNVIKLKTIENEFDGTYSSISVKTTSVTFDSSEPDYLGLSTSNLKVGDLIGFSTYHEYPYNTKIIEIENGKVRTLYPHKVLAGIVTESLEIRRNLNQNSLVGVTSFKLLAEDNTKVFKYEIEPNKVSVSANNINVNHKFETGQLVRYKNIGGSPIGIANTDKVIGGISTNILPPLVYAIKQSNNRLRLSGLIGENRLDITSAGSGLHQFIFENPNSSTLISIDNIIQTPLAPRSLSLDLQQSVGIGSTIIYVNSGITSISSLDTLKIEDEYIRVKSIGLSTSNSVEVERGILGTEIKDHTGVNTVSVYSGNYLINEDSIHFTSAPFGPSGLPGLEINSTFSGRVFTRQFDINRPNDRNILFDDISNQFVGFGSYLLKENGNSIVGVYTNTNSSNSTDINNNPFIFINNINQTVNKSYTIENPEENKIVFIDEAPKSGKILSFDINPGFGYVSFLAGSATATVSAGGTISSVTLTGDGAGYRTAPEVRVSSLVGSGASITAQINSSGNISGFTIVNPGIGYTSSNPPLIEIDEPLPYYNLDLVYSNTSSGIGTEAKVSLRVNSNSSIENFEIINPGFNYKVGDSLTPVGIITDSSVGGSFVPIEITVKEVLNDTFSGFYPGQFLQFNDISNLFNDERISFELFTILNGETRRISFKNSVATKVIENNFFIFINDILQEPLVSYRYSGGRIVFAEPPKVDSTCNILYFVGSSSDIELVTPPQTIKEGDTLKFEDNILTDKDIPQTERVVKRIISSNSLDTFVYEGAGITNIVRPISWTKQKNDRIINSSLVSKSRQNQSSRIYPTSNLIWNVSETDNKIYVDNAYPLFIELDNAINGITEDRRSARILNNSTQTDIPQYENLSSIKAKGDFGKIVGVSTSNTGVGTNSPSIKFELLTDYSTSGYDALNTFGITYSQLEVGDYFIITNSNIGISAGYALTGITTSLGGMSNYPNSKIGTATSIANGIFKVDFVNTTNVSQGIVTVTCHFHPVDGELPPLNISGITTNYYGNYTWSKIYDFEEREIGISTAFVVNTNQGLSGLSSSPTVYRIPPLLF